jgi:diguanylate cyclase (GGDEF)-like protein
MMQAVAGWLSQFNMLLLCLSLLVCSAGSYIVAMLLARGLATPAPRRWPWLLLLVPSFGADVWATHFIAMLAFSPGPQLFYELNRTVFSILVAMAGALPPLALALYRPRRRFTALLSGTGLGLAIAAMHFTGMSALRFCGTAGFDARFGVAGFALGAGLAALAVRLLAHSPSRPRTACAMLALMGAILGLHIVSFFGDAIRTGGVALPADQGSLFAGGSDWLAVLVACVSGLILLAAFIVVLADSRIALMSQEQAAALNYYANHDELTRLANRRQLRARLTELLAIPGQGMVLYYIDVDRFKPLNSLFGHATGDRLLQHVAARLRGQTGPQDMLARIGGDQFMLLQALPAGRPPDTSLAAQLARRMAEPIRLEEGTLRTGISIGLVFGAATPGLEPEVLLSKADVALSAAKALGGGRFCLYHPDMSLQLAARRQLEGDLGEALARQEMFLHFQPLCAANGSPRGFEALLRWRHRERGLISPAEFIPFAERSGHIRAIGLFVLEEACRAAMGWPAHLRVAVNLSAVQLGDDTLFDTIKSILARTGLPPGRLELEITESALIEDAARVGALLQAMHEYGLALAIDDFGTGYSNLSHLRDFCAGRIKIDRSFISGLRGDCDAASIVQAIAGLGHALGMEVLAEGVETASELRLVQAMGCDEVQGYYLARPMPEADVAAWLESARRRVCPVLALMA